MAENKKTVDKKNVKKIEETKENKKTSVVQNKSNSSRKKSSNNKNASVKSSKIEKKNKTVNSNKKNASTTKQNNNANIKNAKSNDNVKTKTSAEQEKELVKLNKKDEETIIEKIKSFLAKIAEMQEEAQKEKLNSKEIKEETKKEKKTDLKLQTNYLLEYYDLPYRYNETVVKILAQTPKRLFVYWDISDEDRLKYVKSFGENFFVDTYPVLLLYNEDKKYIKEIAINDFANSWYIDIDDPKTKYTIQLGRKFKLKPEIVNVEVMQEENIILHTDYLPIAMSNKIEVPNDHILFEKFNSQITFRNVKTNAQTVKDIRKFDEKIAKAYNLGSFYDVYKELYKDGIENGMFDLDNPTSKMTSSSFK